jgi:hypothetical protein
MVPKCQIGITQWERAMEGTKAEIESCLYLFYDSVVWASVPYRTYCFLICLSEREIRVGGGGGGGKNAAGGGGGLPDVLLPGLPLLCFQVSGRVIPPVQTKSLSNIYRYRNKNRGTIIQKIIYSKQPNRGPYLGLDLPMHVNNDPIHLVTQSFSVRIKMQ